MTESSDSKLLAYVHTRVADMLRAGGLDDPEAAVLAAREAVQPIIERYPGNTVVAGMIVGLGVAQMDSLCASMGRTVPAAEKLALRDNANALNRSARFTVAMLAKALALEQRSQLAESAAVPAPPNRAAASPAPALPSHWVGAMRQEASRLQADAPTVPAERRRRDEMWAAVLNNVADELAAKPATGVGKALPPGDVAALCGASGAGPVFATGKASLLGSTNLSGAPDLSALLAPGRPDGGRLKRDDRKWNHRRSESRDQTKK